MCVPNDAGVIGDILGPRFQIPFGVLPVSEFDLHHAGLFGVGFSAEQAHFHVADLQAQSGFPAQRSQEGQVWCVVLLPPFIGDGRSIIDKAQSGLSGNLSGDSGQRVVFPRLVPVLVPDASGHREGGCLDGHLPRWSAGLQGVQEEGSGFLLDNLFTLPDTHPDLDLHSTHRSALINRVCQPAFYPFPVSVREFDLQIVRGLAFIVRDVNGQQVLHDFLGAVNAVKLYFPGRPSGQLVLLLLG